MGSRPALGPSRPALRRGGDRPADAVVVMTAGKVASGEVAPGVTRLVLPLALPLGIHRIPTVNAYLVADESGDTLVDCGIPVDRSRDTRGQRDGTEALEAALAGHGSAFEQVSRLVVTHAHIDHFGLAGEVVRRSGADLWMHRETRLDVATYENPDDAVARRVRVLADHGLHGESLTQAARDLRDWMSALPSIGRATTVVEGGERSRAGGRTWEIVHTPGHSPGHVCLWSAADGVLCSGDHLLNPLSPPVAFDDGSDRDPMGSYLDSLRLVRELAPSLVLPGHGLPFSDGAARAATIEKAKRRRLDEVLSAVTGAITGAITGEEMTAGRLTATLLPRHDLPSAVAEVLACLAYHEVRGRVERLRTRPGTVLWRAVR